MQSNVGDVCRLFCAPRCFSDCQHDDHESCAQVHHFVSSDDGMCHCLCVSPVKLLFTHSRIIKHPVVTSQHACENVFVFIGRWFKVTGHASDAFLFL